MKSLKVFSISLFTLLSFLIGVSIFAEEAQFKVTQISGVNIYHSKVISQDKNIINISFDITNEDQAQSALKYGIQLIKETPGIGQSIADEYISTETLNLSPKETLNKNIKYIAPQGLKGEYTIFLYIKNENGLTLGLGTAGKITLVSSSSTIEILPETCFLFIGEDSKVKYELRQGVDIEKIEILKLTCTAVNPSKESMSVTPLYETHYRTVYGNIVETEGGSTDTLTFKAGEKKSFTFTLPKALTPQAYDVKVSLSNKGIPSNAINAHYVLRGASATIQTFSLDKDGYSVGDIANIKFSWSPSADSFPGSRLGSGSTLSPVTLSISMVDNTDKDCISPISQIIIDSNMDFSPRVKMECHNPKATIILKDEIGNTLDQKVLSFETKTDLENTSKSVNNRNILILIAGILVVTGIALYFINLKKKQDETITQ